jgi:WXG100 family type VII secretion target
MDQILVDFEALERLMACMAASLRNIGDSHDRLTSAVGPVLEIWTGQAAEAYRSRQRGWDDTALRMRQLLADMHNQVARAHANHAAAVRGNTSIWQPG